MSLVIVLSSIGGPGVPLGGRRGPVIASVDVEWTKDYRVRGGNRPFCYSVVWLAAPPGRPVRESTGWDFTAAYIEHDRERGELVEMAALELAAALGGASTIVGHQLCSDLGVLSSHASGPALATVEAARSAWRDRQGSGLLIDTRYDSGAVLRGPSRRLVDVCGELGLGVRQPELGGKSMTALHRESLSSTAGLARERITVLNLRHSLSAALVALVSCGLSPVERPLNVNRMLARGLPDTLAWLGRPEFTATLA